MIDQDMVNIGLSIVILILFILVIRFGLDIQTVDQSERIAVYRFGRFNRVVGPGLVFLIRWIDDPKVRFNMREVPVDIEMPGVFVNGYPLEITLSFRCKFDPIATLGNDRERINNVFQLRENQRRQQIRMQLKDSLSKHIRSLGPKDDAPKANDGSGADEESKEPKGSKLFQSLKPILPGTDEREELLGKLIPDLENILSGEGYRLSLDKPITISQFELPGGLGPMLGRKRQVDELKKQSPDLTDREIAVILAAMEGKPIPNMYEYSVSGGGDATIQHRQRDPDGNEERINIKPNRSPSPQAEPSPKQPEPPAQAPDPQASWAPPPAKPAENTEKDYTILKSDIDLLKPIPEIHR